MFAIDTASSALEICVRTRLRRIDLRTSGLSSAILTAPATWNKCTIHGSRQYVPSGHAELVESTIRSLDSTRNRKLADSGWQTVVYFKTEARLTKAAWC